MQEKHWESRNPKQQSEKVTVNDITESEYTLMWDCLHISDPYMMIKLIEMEAYSSWVKQWRTDS